MSVFEIVAFSTVFLVVFVSLMSLIAYGLVKVIGAGKRSASSSSDGGEAAVIGAVAGAAASAAACTGSGCAGN